MIRYIYTMVAIIISWVLFRAPDITHGFDFVKAMFGGNGMLYQEQAVYFLAQYWPEFILAFFASFPIKTVLEKKLEKTSFGRSILVWWPKLAAAVLLVIVYSKLATGSFNPFIYFRF